MQSPEQIFSLVAEILSREFGFEPEKLAPATHLIDELDLDSIDAIDMAVRLEEKTGVALEEEELRSVQTIQDVVDLIHGRA